MHVWAPGPVPSQQLSWALKSATDAALASTAPVVHKDVQSPPSGTAASPGSTWLLLQLNWHMMTALQPGSVTQLLMELQQYG
jgi:hypothetical protein